MPDAPTSAPSKRRTAISEYPNTGSFDINEVRRVHALDEAIRSATSALDGKDIIARAKAFEDYLKGADEETLKAKPKAQAFRVGDIVFPVPLPTHPATGRRRGVKGEVRAVDGDLLWIYTNSNGDFIDASRNWLKVGP